MSTIVDCPSCGRKLRVPQELLGEKVRCPTCGTVFESAAAPEAELPPREAPAPPRSARVSDPAAPPPVPEPAREVSTETVPPLDLGPRLAVPPVPKLQVKVVEEQQGAPRPSRPAPARLIRDTADPRRPCPACGERISWHASRCPRCGEELEDDDDREGRYPVRRDCEPHRGGVILALGIVSVITGVTCFLSPIGLPLGLAAWVMGHRDLRKIRDGVMDPAGRSNASAGRTCGIIGVALNSLWVLYLLLWFATNLWGATRMAPGPGPGGGGGGPGRFFQRGELRVYEYLPRW